VNGDRTVKAEKRNRGYLANEVRLVGSCREYIQMFSIIIYSL
jgi:hypothetical protein